MQFLAVFTEKIVKKGLYFEKYDFIVLWQKHSE